MKGAAPPPLQQPVMPFRDFLAALFQALAQEGLRPCVLRNYEGFPDKNLANDIDFLIIPPHLPRAIRALKSIPDTRLVGFSERYHVAMTFLEGVSPAPLKRSFQVDFLRFFTWKGLPFLEPEEVLRAAIPRRAGNLDFFVPTPVHEAIISLLAILLPGRWVKEKYFPKVQEIFTLSRPEVIETLRPRFGVKAATRLVNAVIDGDRQEIIGGSRYLRFSLGWRALLCSPVRSLRGIFNHYSMVFAVRFGRRDLETVYILGPDGYGKTTITETLLPLLKSTAVVVERGQPTPRPDCASKSLRISADSDSRSCAPSGSLVSMAKAVLWLLEDWLNQFKAKANITLRLCDQSYQELLIDPQRYGYGGPMWFARLVGKVFPSPDLWILLDPAGGRLQSRDGDVPSEETLWQLEAYRSFVKTHKKYIILDAGRPPDSITEDAYAAIIETLVQRTDKRLKIRF
jgi:thymidylate kinase